MNFKRFMLKGIDKVNVKNRTYVMAHNLKKFKLTKKNNFILNNSKSSY